MKTICFLTMNFHYSSKPGKPIKPIVFFNNFVFTKIHLQNRSHFFALRISVFDRPALFLFMVPSDFNNFFLALSFASIYLSQTLQHIVHPNPFFALMIKHTVKPQRR